MAKKNQTKNKSAVGRPSKFKTINLEHLKFLITKGCSDEEICQFFKIDRATFYRYQQSKKDFCDTIKEWKKYADERVERSLYERAIGYSHPSEEIFCAFGVVTRVKTIKQYAPDTVACIIWLKNRQPDKWREKVPDSSDEGLINEQLEFSAVPKEKSSETEARFSKYMNQN